MNWLILLIFLLIFFRAARKNNFAKEQMKEHLIIMFTYPDSQIHDQNHGKII